MASFPNPVVSYLEQISITARAPAFILASFEGVVLESGGNLARYGLVCTSGQPLPEPWHFLRDFLFMPEEALDLPCMKIGDRPSIDLHLIRSDKGVFIVVLDASAQEFSQGLIQQKSNELSLLQSRQQRLLDQYVGSGIADTIMQLWDPSSQGERRVLTTLFADLRGFTPYSESAPPGKVFQTLNTYLRAMIAPVIEQGGFIDKLIGDQVMALFGLLPTAGNPVVSAILAALQLIESVRALHEQGVVEVGLGVGIGIATGPVALGILGTKQRRAFSAIGHNVNVAARLESHARRGEILIDAASYAQLADDPEDQSSKVRFRQKQLQLKGLTTPMIAYSCELG